MKLFAVLIVLMGFGSIAVGETLFEDAFDASVDDSWIIPNGGWVLDDGTLLNTNSCALQTCMSPLFVGDPTWADYSFTFDFTPTSIPSSDGNVVYVSIAFDQPSLPAVGSSSGYHFDIGWRDNANLVFKNGEPDHVVGDLLVQLSGPQFHLATGTTYRFETRMQEGQLSFRVYPAGTSAPDWQIIAYDARRIAGYCGVSTWATLGYLDNVVVEGTGVVPTSDAAWGSVKALYR